MAISELDEIRCKNSFDLIDASTLPVKTKADLRETIAEAKANLNGRTMEERLMSVARTQFDQSRILAGIVIQFKNVTDELKKPRETKRTWKDVIAELNWWPLCVLGSVLGIAAIFQPQIVSVLTAIVGLF